MFRRKPSSEKIGERAIYAGVMFFLLVVVFFYGKNSYEAPQIAVPMQSVQTKREDFNRQILKKRSTPTRTTPPEDPLEPWIETLSWNPRVFLYHNFLTPEECEEVITLGKNEVTRSEVVSDQGNGRVDDYRTSHGLFFTDHFMKSSPLLRDIERRLAEWTHLPVDNGEAYYLLRYQIGQYYKPHTDFFAHDPIGERYIGDYGNRYATILTYLHTPEAGGSTDFPKAGITVPAKAGDAVLFWDMSPNNEDDPLTQHASLPVEKGEKWAMTKWIREQAFYRWDSRQTENEKSDYEYIDQEWRKEHYK